VLATGEMHTVREFVETAFRHVGRAIEWQGKGLDERARCARTGDILVEVDPRYFRPTEVDRLLGDASKAHSQLGWRHTTNFPELVAEMVEADRLDLMHRRFFNA
jgi:GDPmannose 4,6-dehydratase